MSAEPSWREIVDRRWTLCLQAAQGQLDNQTSFVAFRHIRVDARICPPRRSAYCHGTLAHPKQTAVVPSAKKQISSHTQLLAGIDKKLEYTSVHRRTRTSFSQMSKAKRDQPLSKSRGEGCGRGRPMQYRYLMKETHLCCDYPGVCCPSV